MPRSKPATSRTLQPHPPPYSAPFLMASSHEPFFDFYILSCVVLPTLLEPPPPAFVPLPHPRLFSRALLFKR